MFVLAVAEELFFRDYLHVRLKNPARTIDIAHYLPNRHHSEAKKCAPMALNPGEICEQVYAYLVIQHYFAFLRRARAAKKQVIADIARTKLHPGARPKALGR